MNIWDFTKKITEFGTIAIWGVVTLYILVLWLLSIPASLLFLGDMILNFGMDLTKHQYLLAFLILSLSVAEFFLLRYLLRQKVTITLKKEKLFSYLFGGVTILLIFSVILTSKAFVIFLGWDYYLKQLQIFSLGSIGVIIAIIIIPSIVNIIREPL